MKKINLLIILIMLCNMSYGQEIVTYKKSIKQAVLPSVISKTDNGFPIFLQDNNVFKFFVAYPIINNEVAYKKISYKGYKGDDYYNKGNLLYGIYSCNPKSGGCGVAIGKVNLNDDKPELSYNRIAQFNGSDLNIKSSISENGKLLGLFCVILDNKSKAKSTHLIVADFNGNIVWNNAVGIDFKGESFYVDDIAVSNDGELSVLLNSKTKKKKDQVIDQELLFIVGNADGVEKKMIDFPEYNISSAKSLLKSDGNYFISAYAQSNTENEFDGCFYTIYNSDDNALEELRRQSFGEVVYRDQVINRKMYPKMLYLMERPDGSVTSLGELQSVTHVINNKNEFYMLYTGDIYINHYGADDDYAFQTIQKQQMHQVSNYRHELNENGVSFKAWQNPKGEIFFIYNDNPKNEPNEFVERMSTLLLKSNYGRVTLVTIDEDNQITGNSLMPNDFLFIKHAMDINHGNLYCAINFGKANLCKITLPEQGEYGTLSMNQSEETEDIEDDDEEDDED